MMTLRASAMALGVLAAAPALEAQRTRGTTRSRPVPARRDARAVRLEYANVLLQAGRYDEAAGEFRRLLAANASSLPLRLGLARALAWGGRPREAEAELRTLAARRPGDAGIDSLLREVRASYEPRAAEAARWVAERPAHAPYRRALARALVRDRRAGAAIAHYDTLLAGAGAADRGELLRELAAAHVAAGNREAGIRFLRGMVAAAPGDTGARRALADALAADRRLAPAIAQYDTLVSWHASAPLLMERGRLRAWHRDYAGAEADLRATLSMAPSVEAWLLLGDVHRWRGDHAGARVAYEAARSLRPGDRAVARAFGDLLREERPPIAFVSMPAADAGWRLAGESVEDNTGFSYATAGLRRGFDTRWGVVASVGAEYRSLGERDDGGKFVRRVDGHAVDAGVSRTFAYGRLGARGGAVRHDGTSTLPYGSASAVGWYRAWNASLEAEAAPAYPSLLTLASLLPSDDGAGRPLTARSLTAALAGPIGAADLAASGQRTLLGDDNVRTTLQAQARYALRPRLHVVYAASAIRFAERSTRYWDPIGYVAHGVGVELSSRRSRGFSYAVRVLPGAARAEELVRSADLEPLGVEKRWVPQLSGGGEWGYRSDRWELAAALAYGRGRQDGYERLNSSVAVRLLP